MIHEIKMLAAPCHEFVVINLTHQTSDNIENQN